MATMTLNILHKSMHDYNRQKAPGSECQAWGDFVNDCYSKYACAPWSDDADGIEPSQAFVDYWLAVANEDHPFTEYDETGSRYDAVIGEMLASYN